MDAEDYLIIDYSETLRSVDKFDNYLFRIKGWSILSCGAIVGYGYERGSYAIVFFASIIAILFGCMAFLYKRFHMDAMNHVYDIESNIKALYDSDDSIITKLEHYGLGHAIQSASFAELIKSIKHPKLWYMRIFYLIIATIPIFALLLLFIHSNINAPTDNIGITCSFLDIIGIVIAVIPAFFVVYYFIPVSNVNDIDISVSFKETASNEYNNLLFIKIRNISDHPIYLKSHGVRLSRKVSAHPNAATKKSLIEAKFKNLYTDELKEFQILLLPNQDTSTWIPLDDNTHEEDIDDAIQKKDVGSFIFELQSISGLWNKKKKVNYTI